MNWPWIASLLRCREAESTSTLAAALVREAALPLPLLVWADHQRAGRGRGSNTWFSDEGSLTVTLVLDPSGHLLTGSHWPQVALAVAVSVIDALTPDSPPPAPIGIRWPNDIEAHGRKLAGILPELIQTAHGPRLSIGLGLNLRTRFHNAPGDVQRLGGSLAELGIALDDPEAWLKRWLTTLPGHLDALARDEAWLPNRWQALDQLAGQQVQIQLGAERILSGRACGIAADGALLVETQQGRQSLRAGQVLRV